MNTKRWLSVLMLALVGGALWHTSVVRAPRERFTSYVSAPLLIVLVPHASLEELAPYEKGNVIGVMPTRAGRVGEEWGILETLSTGSRSPVGKAAPRLGAVLRAMGVETIAAGSRASRFLDTRDSQVIPDDVDSKKKLCMALSAENEAAIKESLYRHLAWNVLLIALDVPEKQKAKQERLAPVLLREATRVYSTNLPLLFTSRSTGNVPGLIASTDIASTIASLCGMKTRIGAGQPITVSNLSPITLKPTMDVWAAQARAQKFLKFVPWGLAVLLLVAMWQRWVWLKQLALVYPLGLLVAPCLGVREIWIYLVAALIAAAVTSLGERGVKGAAWATILVVVLDVAWGGWVSARTPLSYSPLEAARFYGIGNEIEGYLIGAALLAGAGDIVATALLGVGVAIVLGAPTLGADFGGFLTSIAAFTVATLVQVKKQWRMGVAVSLAVLALVGTWGVVRGSAGTHVGRVVAGGGEGRGTVIVRKLAMNAHLTLTSPWALLALVQLGLLWRQKKDGAILAGASAVWILNDSGVVAAALLLLWHEKAPGAVEAPRAIEAAA